MYSFITAHHFNEVENGVTHPLFLYLAGSESISRTGAKGERTKEGANIKELDPEYQVLFHPCQVSQSILLPGSCFFVYFTATKRKDVFSFESRIGHEYEWF
jgi:hypothetical protein